MNWTFYSYKFLDIPMPKVGDVLFNTETTQNGVVLEVNEKARWFKLSCEIPPPINVMVVSSDVPELVNCNHGQFEVGHFVFSPTSGHLCKIIEINHDDKTMLIKPID